MGRAAAEEIEVTSRAALRDWLARNHATVAGAWVVTFKKSEGALHVPWPEVVQECLCFGWVDSLPRKKDDSRSMLYIAPRQQGSWWSGINKAHIVQLEKAGAMAESGRAAVARAKADGSWTALDAVENGEVPDDLAAALAAVPGARAVWDEYARTVRRGALEALARAKRPATRAARIATILDAVQGGTRPFQWNPKAKPPE